MLAYYALWLPLILVDYRQTLGNYAKLHWIVAFAMVACLSVFWSAAPAVTVRAGLQLLSHVACALIAARTVGIRTLTLGSLIGALSVLAYSLAFGSYHYDDLDGSYTFVGAFASKNQLGLFASLGVYFAFAASLFCANAARGACSPSLAARCRDMRWSPRNRPPRLLRRQ